MSQFTTAGQKLLETPKGTFRHWTNGEGSGPAVVFLQGFLAGPDAWTPAAADAFPCGHLEMIKDPRTFVPHDQPAQLTELLAGLLGGQDRR